MLWKHIGELMYSSSHCYSSCGTWWHTRRNQISSFPNGRVYLNRWGRQFSRLLEAEVCASAWVMLDRPRSQVAWEYWLPTPFASFPFTSPPVRHLVPPGSERALPSAVLTVIFQGVTAVLLSLGSCRWMTVKCTPVYVISLAATCTEDIGFALHFVIKAK